MKLVKILIPVLLSTFLISLGVSSFFNINLLICIGIVTCVNILLGLNIFLNSHVQPRSSFVLKSFLLSIGFGLFIFFAGPSYQIRIEAFVMIVVGGIFPAYSILTLLNLIPLPAFSNSQADVNFSIKSYELFLLIIPSFFIIFWFVNEKHGIYGDEAAHLQMIRNALFWFRNDSGFFYRLKVLYIFDLRYPPLFYLLSVPFIFIVNNWLLGARLFVMILGILNLLLMYILLRKKFTILSSFIGILFLGSCFQYLLASRYYGQEILLITFLLVLLIFMFDYLQKDSKLIHQIMGIIIAFGFLIKYNFIIFLIPIILFYSLELIKKYKENKFRNILINFIHLALPVILLSGPWYIYTYLINPDSNAIKGLLSGKQYGDFSSNVSFLTAFQQSFRETYSYYPGFLYLIIIFLLFFSFRYFLTLKKNDIKLHLFIISVCTMILLPVFLKVLGIHMLRWNLSYMYLPIIAAFLFDRSAFINKYLKQGIGILISILLIIIIINNTSCEIIPQQFLNKSALIGTDYELLPQSTTTGAEEIVKFIKDDWIATGNDLESTIKVGYIGHIHEGLHGHAFSFYGSLMGFSKWGELNIGILDQYRPANVNVFVDSDYLIFIPGQTNNSNDVYLQYQAIIDDPPSEYTKCLNKVGQVNSRFGLVIVYKVNHDCITPNVIYTFISEVIDMDIQKPISLFWKLELLSYYQKFQDISITDLEKVCINLEKEFNANTLFDTYYTQLWTKKFDTICK